MLDHKISITEVLTSEDILIQKVVFEEFTVVTNLNSIIYIFDVEASDLYASIGKIIKCK